MSVKSIQDPYHPVHYPLLIVISGPSGVGKDSVVKELQQQAHPFHFVVTANSRPARPDEVNGVDYFFVTDAEFEELIRNDELLEHAIVYGQHKGVPKRQVREAFASNKDVVMRLDVQGAITVKRMVPEAVLIFLNATSEGELRRRLQQRGTETESEIAHRLEVTTTEFDCLAEFDYLIFNHQNQLASAVEEIMCIVTSEHARTQPRQAVL